MQFTFFYQKIILVDFSTKNQFLFTSNQKFSHFLNQDKLLFGYYSSKNGYYQLINTELVIFQLLFVQNGCANNNPNNNIGRKKMWVIAQVLKRKDQKRARKYAIYVFFTKKSFWQILVPKTTFLSLRFRNFHFFSCREKLLFGYYSSKNSYYQLINTE